VRDLLLSKGKKLGLGFRTMPDDDDKRALDGLDSGPLSHSLHQRFTVNRGHEVLQVGNSTFIDYPST
jgi:hypothetical protein